jgi:hypothetical protein
VRKLKKFLESNKTETTIYQNIWDIAKALLNGKFIAVSAYIKKAERSQISN